MPSKRRKKSKRNVTSKPIAAKHKSPRNPDRFRAHRTTWYSRLQWKYLLLGGFWTGMFIGTHLPKVPQQLEKVSDKTLHASSFTGLSLLLCWATCDKVSSAPRHWGMVLLIIAVYGAIDEVLQIPVGRHCDFNDWLADMSGATIGLTLFYLGLIIRSLVQRTSYSKPIGASGPGT